MGDLLRLEVGTRRRQFNVGLYPAAANPAPRPHRRGRAPVTAKCRPYADSPAPSKGA